METGTFPKDKVSNQIKKYFIPLRYESSRDSEQFRRFDVRVVPVYIVLDPKGDEIYRAAGFFNEDDFIGQLEIARKNARPYLLKN